MRDRVIVFFNFLGLSCLACAQTAVMLLLVLHIQFLDPTGRPLSNGKVFAYQAGTPLATYTDSTGSTQNADPAILTGSFSDVWPQAGQSHKILIQDSSGLQQWVVDGVAGRILLNSNGNAEQNINGQSDLRNFALGSVSKLGGVLWVDGTSIANLPEALSQAGDGTRIVLPCGTFP